MKKLLTTAILSAFIAMAGTSAYAGDYPTSGKEKRIERNWEYWNGKTSDSNAKRSDRQMAASPKSAVSQYPCGNCVYSVEMGGYVERPLHRK